MINSDLNVVFTYKVPHAKSVFHGKLYFFVLKCSKAQKPQTSLNPKYHQRNKPSSAEAFEVWGLHGAAAYPELRKRIQTSERKPERGKSDTFRWSPQLGIWAGARFEVRSSVLNTNGQIESHSNTQWNNAPKHLWVQLELTTNHLCWRWGKWELC